jgi:hypothetical protein
VNSGDRRPGQWIEPAELLDVVQRDVSISGVESPTDVLLREPGLLIPVPDPASPPLDISTYEARWARWREGSGPRLTGMDEFMLVLRESQAPASAVFVRGESTTYCFLLDARRSRVTAAVAVDPPNGEASWSLDDDTAAS